MYWLLAALTRDPNLNKGQVGTLRFTFIWKGPIIFVGKSYCYVNNSYKDLVL